MDAKNVDPDPRGPRDRINVIVDIRPYDCVLSTKFRTTNVRKVFAFGVGSLMIEHLEEQEGVFVYTLKTLEQGQLLSYLPNEYGDELCRQVARFDRHCTTRGRRSDDEYIVPVAGVEQYQGHNITIEDGSMRMKTPMMARLLENKARRVVESIQMFLNTFEQEDEHIVLGEITVELCDEWLVRRGVETRLADGRTTPISYVHKHAFIKPQTLISH